MGISVITRQGGENGRDESHAAKLPPGKKKKEIELSRKRGGLQLDDRGCVAACRRGKGVRRPRPSPKKENVSPPQR